MRQVPDESHSVREKHLALGRKYHLPQCGIERGKHACALQYAGLGQGIEQCRFAGVGIADQGNRGDGHGFAALALLTANAADIVSCSLTWRMRR